LHPLSRTRAALLERNGDKEEKEKISEKFLSFFLVDSKIRRIFVTAFPLSGGK
jgi:hypothetical protein